MHTIRSLAVTAALLAGLGLAQARAQDPQPAGPSVNGVEFQGTIKSVNLGTREIVIEPTGVPDVTTLPYTVPDSVDISKFQQGGQVKGRVVVRDDTNVIESLEVSTSMTGEKTADPVEPGMAPKPDEPRPDTTATPAPATPPSTGVAPQ